MVNDRGFWSIRELAEYLNESVSTIYYWVHTRKIPFVKRGRRLQFKISEILKWDEANAHAPIDV